jgi:hypothetical protein
MFFCDHTSCCRVCYPQALGLSQTSKQMAAQHPREVLSEVRTARFNALVAELIPKIRRLGPDLSEEALIETAQRLADHRLASEGLGSVRQ